MQGRTTALQITLDPATHATMEHVLRAQKTPQAYAKRVRAILLLAAGEKLTAIEQQVGLAERHIRKWAKRFISEGLVGLQDRPRPGRPPVFPPRGNGACRQDGL
jgi:hypothetical protein